MLSSKQMLAATDCRTETTVIAAPSIVFPFESISGRLDSQDNRSWFPVSVVLIGTDIEHYSDDLRGLLDAGAPTGFRLYGPVEGIHIIYGPQSARSGLLESGKDLR
jgi:hypothetical protein